MQTENKGKHLQREEREEIQRLLCEGLTFKAIGARLMRDATTIAKEVRQHRYRASSRWNTEGPVCARREDCRRDDLCRRPVGKKCKKLCKNCPQCHCHCPAFLPERCRVEGKAPFVCNGCEKRRACRLDKWFYGADSAQKTYERTLCQRRAGICLTRDELSALDDLVSPLVRKGQPIAHILKAHQGEILISERTFRRYIDQGLLSVRNIDLRRVVRYKPRKKRPNPKPPESKAGHRYVDFCALLDQDPSQPVVEMDTVEGHHLDQKHLLTLYFRHSSLMLIYLLPNLEMKSVTQVFDQLEERLGKEAFRTLFPLILTDNGSEFAGWKRLETSPSGERRTRIYYCDARMSGQKGALEHNHTYIRCVLPKGTSFEFLTDELVKRLASHINSTIRPATECTPHALAVAAFGSGPVEKLGLELIPADEVVLTKALLTR